MAPQTLAAAVVDPVWPASVLLAAPALCALPGWVPALRAARTDPAAVLHDD